MKFYFDEIKKNNIKTVLLFFIFFILILVLGSVFGIFLFNNPRTGIILAGIFGVFYSIIMYSAGAKTVLSVVRAKPIKKQDDPYIYNVVEGLSIAAGLKKPPKVFMINEESMNAFATGISPDKSYICITSGLRNKMNRSELEGVLAHEMSHIKNYDIRVMLLAAVLVGVVVLISDMLFRSLLWGRRRDDENNGFNFIMLLIAIGFAVLTPIVAEIIKLAISRKREFLADASAVELTRNPSGLISALKKIKNDTDKVVDSVNKATAHLFFENPLRNAKHKSFFSGLFSTHPPIDERIKRLESML